MKRVMAATAVILGTLLLLAILWQFRVIVLLFVLSLFLAAAIRPSVDWLSARGLSPAAAQLLLYAAGLGVLVLLLALFGGPLLTELNDAANRAVVGYELRYQDWSEDGVAWQEALVGLLPPPLTVTNVQDGAAGLLPLLQGASLRAMNLFAGLAALLVVLASSAYWTADRNRFERLWLSVLPPRGRAYARDSWREIETAVGGYLRSQAAQSVLAAMLLGLGAWLGGFDFPLLLAAFGGVAAFMPLFFGGLVTAVFAYGLGLLQGAGAPLLITAYTLLVYLLLDLFVEPRLWARRQRSLLLTILVVVPLFAAYGLWGVLAAPPLAAVIGVLIAHGYRLVTQGRETAVRLDALERRALDLQEQIIAAEDGEVPPELQNMTARLTGLLAAARQL